MKCFCLHQFVFEMHIFLVALCSKLSTTRKANDDAEDDHVNQHDCDGADAVVAMMSYVQ